MEEENEEKGGEQPFPWEVEDSGGSGVGSPAGKPGKEDEVRAK